MNKANFHKNLSIRISLGDNMINTCEHEKAVINFTKCNGCQGTKEFLKYLLLDDKRIKDENKNTQIYDDIDILNPEYMDSSEIASFQWCRDNPDWYKNL